MMDLSRLYTDQDRCRLCEGARGDHDENCPGAVLEDLGVEVVAPYSEGCRGHYTSGTVEGFGSTVEAALQSASADLVRHEISPGSVGHCSMRYVGSEGHGDLLDSNQTRNALVEKANTAYARQQEAAFRQRKREELEALERTVSRELQSLEAQRADFTPDAYARRRAQLEASVASQRALLGA
jgi:hypothetical protein